MAVFVLVHGGGHGGWCYRKVAAILRDAGHEIHTPTLSGLAERSHLLHPGIDLDTHILDVTELLRYDDLREVILVGHSYGGMVITGVADRTEPGRVGKVVYLDAANPKNGQSLDDVAGGLMRLARSMGQVVDGVELVLFPEREWIETMYGVTDPDDVQWVFDRLTPHPWKCFEQPLVLSSDDALADVPQFHIVCTSTLATRDPELMTRARDEGRLWTIDTGHDLMITEPQAVADALLAISEA